VTPPTASARAAGALGAAAGGVGWGAGDVGGGAGRRAVRAVLVAASNRGAAGGDGSWAEPEFPQAEATVVKLGWPELCEHVAAFASTELGRRAAEDLWLPPSRAASEVRATRLSPSCVCCTSPRKLALHRRATTSARSREGRRERGEEASRKQRRGPKPSNVNDANADRPGRSQSLSHADGARAAGAAGGDGGGVRAREPHGHAYRLQRRAVYGGEERAAQAAPRRHPHRTPRCGSMRSAERRLSESADAAERRLSESADAAERRLSESADAAERRLSESADTAERRLSESADAVERRLSESADTAERRLSERAGCCSPARCCTRRI
jgi:hypothetical protein